MQIFTTNLLVRKFSVKEVFPDYLASRPKICGNCPFNEDFLTRKLGKKNCILRCDSIYFISYQCSYCRRIFRNLPDI